MRLAILVLVGGWPSPHFLRLSRTSRAYSGSSARAMILGSPPALTLWSGKKFEAPNGCWQMWQHRQRCKDSSEIGLELDLLTKTESGPYLQMLAHDLETAMELRTASTAIHRPSFRLLSSSGAAIQGLVIPSFPAHSSFYNRNSRACGETQAATLATFGQRELPWQRATNPSNLEPRPKGYST
jgi:hypothetical protein